jgi:hypothetical protein
MIQVGSEQIHSRKVQDKIQMVYKTQEELLTIHNITSIFQGLPLMAFKNNRLPKAKTKMRGYLI